MLYVSFVFCAHRWIDHWRWKRKAFRREIENCHRNRKRRREWVADACQSAAIIWEWAIWWNHWIHRKHFPVVFQLQWVSFETFFNRRDRSLIEIPQTICCFRHISSSIPFRRSLMNELFFSFAFARIQVNTVISPVHCIQLMRTCMVVGMPVEWVH